MRSARALSADLRAFGPLGELLPVEPGADDAIDGLMQRLGMVSVEYIDDEVPWLG